MRYTNVKTGAIVNSSSIIKGDNWTLVEPVIEPVIEQKKPVKKVISKTKR